MHNVLLLLLCFYHICCFSTEENVHIRKHSCEVEAQLSQYKADFQRLQEKHKTLTEYFEQKEHNLHRLVSGLDLLWGV